MVTTTRLTESKLTFCAIHGLAFACLTLSLAGCGGHSDHAEHDDHVEHGDHSDHAEHDDHAHGGGDSWSVTAWGSAYEIFPEIDALVAGDASAAHTHVTILDGFGPLTDGRVEIVLTDSDGEEQVFSATEPIRPGIYQVEVAPRETGDFELAFRIESAAGDETIQGGRVRVGTADEPGGIVRAPAPRGATSGGEPVDFLKEQQWQAAFGTDWIRKGKWARALEGLAEARPAAGGEAWITAPVDGLVASRPWPFVGQEVAKGDALFRLTPSISPGRSLAELKADLEAAREELGSAESRLARLQELIEVEATSRRELEEAQTRAAIARARLTSARQDLKAARAVREGRGSGAPLEIEAPFSGRVASVEATPGAAAGAAERLARVVRTDVVWLAVALTPDAASELSAALSSGLSDSIAGVVLGDSHGFSSEVTRLVSVAPGVDPATGKLDVLVEIPGETVPLGSTWNAQVLLAEEYQGIVVPTSALVDDGGQTVVFLQVGGESFVRQPVTVEARQGDRALVTGLVPGQRLVVRGGESIRRSTLMSTGAGHGHVH